MVCDYSVCLKVKDVRHDLRAGINILGSAKYNRYTTIFIDDKNICPKHASFRYDPKTTKLEVMDLCSELGVTVDQRPIEVLTWCEITTLSQVLFGTLPVLVVLERIVPASEDGETGVSRNKSLSFLLDEDSTDFIDCSLAETQLLPSRKGGKSTSAISNGSQSGSTAAEDITTLSLSAPSPKDSTDRRSSFLVPATQQLEDSAISTVVGPTVAVTNVPIVPEKVIGSETTGPLEALDGDDEFFFIPETQQPIEENGRPSPAISPIEAVAYKSERAVRTHEVEEYFQMTNQDNENSNDGLFNNEYIVDSQNLLQNLNESYTTVEVVGRKMSILPERSVDSISFQEHRNTTQDMSRLEWNESKQEQESSLSAKVAVPIEPAQPGKKSAEEHDDRSITPELHFDEPHLGTEREGTVTPEVDFDRLGLDGVLDASKAEQAPSNSAVTPVLCFGEEEEDDLHEISLNQEGSNRIPNDIGMKETSSKAVENIYDTETQVLDFDCVDGLDAQDDKFKQPAAAVESNQSKKQTNTEVDAYAMETQALSYDTQVDVDPYDLLTQLMESPGKRSFLKQSNRSTIGSKEPVTPDRTLDDFPTQPMIPPNFTLRTSYKNRTHNEPQPTTSSRLTIDPADAVTQPMTPPDYARLSRKNKCDVSTLVDPDDLLTQPMSPPKHLLEEFHGWKRLTSESFDAYEQQTQPLNRTLATKKEEKRPECPTRIMENKKPVVKLVDIRHLVSPDSSDPYTMQTQPLKHGRELNAYELLTQPMITEAAAVFEISHFDPQINSTTRQSLLQHGSQLNYQKNLEISPSSNKENQTARAESTDDEEQEEEQEDLDDEICLAQTIPVHELVTGGIGKAGPRTKQQPFFKMPSGRAEVLSTPQSRATKAGGRSVQLTEFLTPEHPLLSLPKADSILMASGNMRELAASHYRDSKSKPNYHFDDSSSGSEGEDRLIFKKTNVSVALEKELEKVKEISMQKKQDEGSRAKKKDELVQIEKRKASKKDPPSSKERDSKPTGSEKTNEKASSSRRPTKPSKDKEQERTPVRRKAKKDDGKIRESKRSKESNPKDKATSSSSTKNVHTTDDRASSHRQRSDPVVCVEKLANDVATSSTAATSRSMRIRKRNERLSAEPDDKKTRSEDVSETAVQRRKESKRQTSTKHRSSPSLAEATKKPSETERPRRTATLAKKVDGTSSFSSGMLIGENSVSTGGRNERLMDVSASSSNTVSDCSTRYGSSNRHTLIFTRMSPEPYRKCIARAGGKIVDMPELATVLVTDRIFRTYKFLCAVAKGIPIVGQSYLDAMQAADENERVDPWAHVLCDSDTEKRYKFRLRDTLLRARHHKLFQDYTVFVTSSTQPPPSELYLILSCAGAKALKHPGVQPKNIHKMFVISDPSDAASWPKYKEKYPTIEIVTAEGFMLSIMQHSIGLKKHRLVEPAGKDSC